MLKISTIISTILLGIFTIGLFVSALSYHTYIKQHPEIRQQIIAADGNTEILKKACEKIQLPLLADLMNVFVPLTFTTIILTVVIFMVGLLKPSPIRARLFPLGIILVSGISFFSTQVWEPDFAYVVCTFL